MPPTEGGCNLVLAYRAVILYNSAVRDETARLLLRKNV